MASDEIALCAAAKPVDPLLMVEVKLLIFVAFVESALDLVEASVLIAEVRVLLLLVTVVVKLVKEDAVELCALVTVTISDCAEAIAAVSVLPVKLVAPNTLTKVASRPATQALFAAFLVYTCPSSVSNHMSFTVRAELSSLVLGDPLLRITLAATAAVAATATSALVIRVVKAVYPGKFCSSSDSCSITAAMSSSVVALVPLVPLKGPGTLDVLTNLTQ